MFGGMWDLAFFFFVVILAIGLRAENRSRMREF